MGYLRFPFSREQHNNVEEAIVVILPSKELHLRFLVTFPKLENKSSPFGQQYLKQKYNFYFKDPNLFFEVGTGFEPALERIC
jgi:hypothetical protein